MNRFRKRSLSATLFLLSLATMAGTSRAQTQTTRDPLVGLKRALQEAGAAALTSPQETSLNALITAFRAAHQTHPTPGADVQNARTAYDNAILSQDGASAAAPAAIIASGETANSLQRQTDLANFGIDVVKVLTSGGDQVALSSLDLVAAVPCDCCSVWPAARALAGGTSVRGPTTHPQTLNSPFTNDK